MEAIVSLDDDDVLLLEPAVPVAALADETAPLLSLAVAVAVVLAFAFAFAGLAPTCWAAAWKSVARNCWSAAVTDSVELDEVLEVLDVESVAFDDVLPDVAADVLLSEPSPSDASAAAMAAASASMGDVPDELDELDVPLADSSASFDDELPLVLCVLEIWPDVQIEYKEFELVSALIDM